MRMKDKSEKAGLTLNIKRCKIMSPDPISSWQIEREKLEAVTDFIFLGSKIIVDNDCNQEIRRCFLLGRKVMTNLNQVLKVETSLC